jgi:signal transduction histidine kinase
VGKILYYREKFDEAEMYMQKALQMAQDIQSKLLIRNCYNFLAALEYERNNLKKAFQYNELSLDYEIELVSAETQNKLNFMAVKYETEKKETQIATLETEKRLLASEKRMVTWLGIAGGTVLLLALSAALFLWRWTVQKRRLAEKQKQLAEHQIIRLEQEKQLVATQSLLDGETQERARLARDLHDGLGSKLTGVKLHLQELRRGAQWDEAAEEQYHRAMDMLDDSVFDMRRVSHNLMPAALTQFGLKQAVEDFCRSVSPIIVFNHFGDETRLDTKLELLIYRCISELVNNALKYSGASEIMVQIIRDADSIEFTVQDNGCGFDPDAATKGTGLKNIRTRVASFGGNIQIRSKAGEGTEINIEIQ